MKRWIELVFAVLLLLLPWATAGADNDPGAVIQPKASVQPSAPDTPAPMTDIHDILPPVRVGADLSWLVPALLAVGAIIIVAVLWWWWKRRRKGQTPETIVPELPPEMLAMRSLNEINDVRIMDGKTFYFRLSAIVRQYVFGRFAIGAPEMTTEEFLPCIDKLPIDGALARRLKWLSLAMDPVKFGGQTAVERQMEADLSFARDFVRNTTPSDE